MEEIFQIKVAPMIMREYHTHQAIATSYRFGSYGNATVWGTEVEQAGDEQMDKPSVFRIGDLHKQ